MPPTTALGALLPILRDAGVLNTRFGANVMAVGAVGEFGPIVLIAVLLGGDSDTVTSILLLASFVLLALAACQGEEAPTPTPTRRPYGGRPNCCARGGANG